MADVDMAAGRAIVTCAQAKADGLKTYFTGRPCPKGHVAERFVSSRGCLSCAAEARASFDRAKMAAYAAKSRAKDPERAREVHASFYKRHREQRRQEAREAYAADPAKGRARTKAWRERNPTGVRAHAMARHARKLGAEGSYTAEDVTRLFDLQRGRCTNCRTSLAKAFHVDHVTPLSRGGRNDRSNLQLLCPFCNISKHAADPIEWARRNGRLL